MSIASKLESADNVRVKELGMQIQSNRFGTLEIEVHELIKFPQGIIGFPNEREYVLLRKNIRSAIGWLQSTTNPTLAFPVVSLDAISVDAAYYDAIGRACGVELDVLADKLAVIMIVCASAGGPPSVNLLAPVVVDIETRSGAQIFLLDTKYSTREPMTLRERTSPSRSRSEGSDETAALAT